MRWLTSLNLALISAGAAFGCGFAMSRVSDDLTGVGLMISAAIVAGAIIIRRGCVKPE